LRTDKTRRDRHLARPPSTVTVGPKKRARKPPRRKRCRESFELLRRRRIAFDPHVAKRPKRYGKLTVLPAKMNPDLGWARTLKRTGAGNFMVFGEPDSRSKTTPDRSSPDSKGVTCTTRPTGPIRSAPPTISPAGSSTPITMVRASSSAPTAYFRGSGGPPTKTQTER